MFRNACPLVYVVFDESISSSMNKSTTNSKKSTGPTLLNGSVYRCHLNF